MNDKKDEKIIELLFARDESGLREAEEKYSGFCISVLANILVMKEDREECVNDALLALWNNIPPERPKSLSAYLAKILRNLAFARTRSENAWRRGGKVVVVGEELLGDITDGRTLADDYESALAGRIINDFLGELPKGYRKLFLLRYWFDEDISRIARRTGKSPGAIKALLKRLRERLREKLEKEGIIV